MGYGFEELRDLTPLDIKPELNEHQFKEKVRPLLESGSGDIVFETVHQQKDGSLYDVSVHLQLIPQEDESIFFAAIRDVTRENELKRVLEQREKELEEALAARETLLQEVNHRDAAEDDLPVPIRSSNLLCEQTGNFSGGMD